MCFVMPFANDFWFFKLLFTIVGISFALIKISVFTSIGLVTNTDKEHSSFMGYLEGFFMIGVLEEMFYSVYSLMTIIQINPLAECVLGVGRNFNLVILFLFFSKLDEHEAKSEKTDLLGDLRNSASFLVIKSIVLFIMCFSFCIG
jgi:hypothetical protein